MSATPTSAATATPAAPGTRHPLDAIFRPRAVAVIGASRRPDSIGRHILNNLFNGGYQGKLFPVNRTADVLHSVKCYPSVRDIPDAVDLAVITVPKVHVLDAVEDCGRKGVGGLVVITAGFREVGPEGARAEEEVLAAARRYGMRLIGPNCMGVINADPAIALDATFAPTPALPGPIGFASQSGALGVAILNFAARLGVGFTQFVSMGNKADVSGNDLLEYWEHDPATRLIALYLESFGNPRKFTELARRITRTKPIIVVKSGRTSAGARAASSHTGALAGSDAAIDALLDQCGVIRAPTIEEMFDLALALSSQPLPAGDRIAVLSNAGGPAIMATDACVQSGLALAELSDATRAGLRALLPPEASVANPVDMIASATAEKYAAASRLLLADPAVDAALVINVPPVIYNPIDISRALVSAIQDVGKPVLSVFMAQEVFYAEARGIPGHPPIYRFPEPAARVLADLVRIGRRRRRPAGEVRRFTFDEGALRRILAAGRGRLLTPTEVAGVLKAVGIPLVRQEAVAEVELVAAAAKRLGYPVAVKAAGAGIVHKSDVGAVVLGIRSEAELATALTRMEVALQQGGLHADSYLVQKMVADGREILLGATQDPKFGPLVVFGLGGKYVEVFGDVRFRLAPLTPEEARETVEAIRGAKLLAGVRGERPSDRAFLAEMLERVAQLAFDYPEILEMDVNPLLALERGGVAVDARVRVR